jgi:prevent-host-death family protein
MAKVYSPDEARAQFGRILDEVRSGERVVIVDEGRELAEIRSNERFDDDLEALLPRLVKEGLVSLPARPHRPLAPLASKAGALARFLESRQ